MPQQPRKHVLVVEDDKLMRKLYEHLFKKHELEFSCRLEGSAEGALNHLRRHSADAAILDWDLPGINGLNLAKALRSSPATKSLRIIIVSGRARPEDEVHALESGADDYLSKPFAVEVLLARLRSLMRR